MTSETLVRSPRVQLPPTFPDNCERLLNELRSEGDLEFYLNDAIQMHKRKRKPEIAEESTDAFEHFLEHYLQSVESKENVLNRRVQFVGGTLRNRLALAFQFFKAFGSLLAADSSRHMSAKDAYELVAVFCADIWKAPFVAASKLIDGHISETHKCVVFNSRELLPAVFNIFCHCDLVRSVHLCLENRPTFDELKSALDCDSTDAFETGKWKLRALMKSKLKEKTVWIREELIASILEDASDESVSECSSLLTKIMKTVAKDTSLFAFLQLSF